MEITVVDNKITLIYKKQNLELTIPVNSFCIRRKSEQSNPGTILEDYRSLRQQGEAEFAVANLRNNRELINTYINRCNNTEQEEPDYVQVFNTSDSERNEVIEYFKTKMLASIFSNKPVPDYSKHFNKLNRELSIRVDEGTFEEKAKNFSYQKPVGLNTVKRLWIIDDTLDTGATVEIFLDALLSEGLLTPETKITVFILYNNLKKDSAFKGLTKENLVRRLNG